ncbi:MAG TPA: hypothetical protein VG711_04260, partial [Phycisphaerales bacterium]|nr:hypothetical protein [Phycisphaerales bacterium]
MILRALTLPILIFAVLCTCGQAFAQQKDVDVVLDTFGFGSAYRPGDMTAIRVKLTSNRSESMNVWVQIEVTNADGDICEAGRTTALTPSQPKLVWLYAALPPQTDNSSSFLIRVFEEVNGRRTSEIGGARIFPADAQAVANDPATAMIGVVGTSRLGLDHYRATAPNGTNPATNELSQIVSGLLPADFPDRWEGLQSYSAIVWSGDRSAPGELTIEQTEALREYIRRGNHLIVSLPSAGNTWDLGATQKNPLGDLLITGMPRKDESVPLSSIISTITKSNNLKRFINTRDPLLDFRVFKDLRGTYDAIDNHYEPLVALPDGRVIAIQRTFGFGRITLIGLDLADGRLSATPPQGDAFWNRILGRRADTPTSSEFASMENDILSRSYYDSNVPVATGRTFSKQISMTRQATIGLSLAIFLFIAYWVACVGGFFVLKGFKRSHLSWLTFTATAGIFTLFAWGAVAWQQQTSISIKHVTFLDHIARAPNDIRPEDPQVQRAVSFFSAYLPAYANMKIRIVSDPNER